MQSFILRTIIIIIILNIYFFRSKYLVYFNRVVNGGILITIKLINMI